MSEIGLHVVFGAGQVGRVLSARLAAGGLAVRVLSRKRPSALPEGAEWRAIDATDPVAATDAAEGASVIYQCLNAPYTSWPASSPPLQRGVMTAAERCGALLVSLENVYGYGRTDGKPMTEDLPLTATTRKGRTRAAMTAELFAAAAQGRVRVAIGRASDFFGMADTIASHPSIVDGFGGEHSAPGYRTLLNPGTGEQIQFIARLEGGGDVVRFNWSSVPGGAIPEHSHPHQEETFIISAGQANFTLNGQQRLVGAGETITVPVGVAHSEANAGTVPVEGTVELRPARHSRQMHEAFAGLAAEGKTTGRGAPKNPLQLGATLWYFRHESRVTSPPVWVQNLILPPLSVLAKLLGVRAYAARWDSEYSEADLRSAAKT